MHDYAYSSGVCALPARPPRDLFGHVPLLIQPVFVDYMHAYGRAALAADGAGALPLLARALWVHRGKAAASRPGPTGGEDCATVKK
ncbi:hypothetical protein OKW43_002693 [Paraburkholderia sp. WC7.3g]